MSKRFQQLITVQNGFKIEFGSDHINKILLWSTSKAEKVRKQEQLIFE